MLLSWAHEPDRKHFTWCREYNQHIQSNGGIAIIIRLSNTMALPDISHLSLPQAYSYVPPIDQDLVNPHELRLRRQNPWELSSKPSIPKKTEGSTFMRLPLEIRQHILTYVLPQTIGLAGAPKRDAQVTWLPGCTAVLAASRQLHDEAAKMMYGNAEFLVQVSYDGIKFLLYRKLSGSGLTPKQTPELKRQVRERYWCLIRRVRVKIVVEDSYTAEIKYGWGGPGLVAGVNKQVQVLADILNRPSMLQTLRVTLQCARMTDSEQKEAQDVLRPFRSLRNVMQSSWEGPIDPTFVEQLSRDTAYPK